MQATRSVRDIEREVNQHFPPLHSIDYHPDVWIYGKQVGPQRVEETYVEDLCAYICRIFVYIITFAFLCDEGFLYRRYEYQVRHEVVETFTCLDSRRAGVGDVQHILTYLYASYRPLVHSNLEDLQAESMWTDIQHANRFTIIGKRTTANLRETCRLEITYNDGQQTRALPVRTRNDVSPLTDESEFRRGGVVATYAPLMRRGAAFVLQQDDLSGVRASYMTRYAQMGSAFQWLGMADHSSRFPIIHELDMVLNRCLSGYDRVLCDYSSREMANGHIPFEHNGYWIVKLCEENGQKSLKLILDHACITPFPTDEAALRMQLQRKLAGGLGSRPEQLLNVNITPFVDSSEGQIGYEVTLRR